MFLGKYYIFEHLQTFYEAHTPPFPQNIKDKGQNIFKTGHK